MKEIKRRSFLSCAVGCLGLPLFAGGMIRRKPVKEGEEGWVLTAEFLKSKGMHPHDLAVFSAEWPNGCEVTLENCIRSAELELFLPGRVLSDHAYRMFRRADIKAWREERIRRNCSVKELKLRFIHDSYGTAFFHAWKLDHPA